MEDNENRLRLITLDEQNPSLYQNEWLQKLLDDNKTKPSLNLFYELINDDDMKMIAKEMANNKTRIILNLSCSPITAKGCQYLCNALERNSTLEALFLCDNHLGDDGAQFVWQLLLADKNKTIRAIDLSLTELTDNCIDKIVEVMKTARIRYIDIEKNHLSIEGKQQLRQAAIDNNYTGKLYL
ncbi:unnamed protein product [Didymodactylos carnosus]|uniref:Uncharacterized protein n=1 Tax=Didymodactylos carnosus TaxID=1234261 RepID=A0A815ET99_9BILA|nr:unnamed protein product [Didymodactylos carnosus]CAF4157728.1 unnamed protein product [Didymodactylos carnosus]